MLGLKYLILITQREYSEKYMEFFRRHNVNRVLSILSHGTASEKTLDYFGIEKTEKITFEAMIPDQIKDDLVKDMYLEMNIGGAGNGIAVFLNIDGIGGASSLKYFVGDQQIEKKENVDMNEVKTVLIITIVDKGNTELVMEAARSAGASGGTVVRAKGTGAEIAKFFGVSISEEKEMVYIVADRESRDAIMRAVMEKAGNDTDAHGVVFSLPVDSVVGIKRYEHA